MRELTWALLPGEELFAPAETLRSESLDSSSVYSKVCHTRIIRLEASGLGFGDVVVAGVWCLVALAWPGIGAFYMIFIRFYMILYDFI